MSQKFFNQILKLIHNTDKSSPPYKDHVLEVRQLINGWNKNINDVFESGLLNCLDLLLLLLLLLFLATVMLNHTRKCVGFQPRAGVI